MTKMMAKEEVECLIKEHIVLLLKDFDQFRKEALDFNFQQGLVRLGILELRYKVLSPFFPLVCFNSQQTRQPSL